MVTYPKSKRRSRRCGLTLLEVILAIAILGGALAVIGELIRLGSRNAAQARDLTTAQLYCESKLNALAAGIEEPVAVSASPLDDTGEWIYFVEPQETNEEGMIALRVTVAQDPESVARPVMYSLSRWILDPAVEEAAAAAAADMEAKAKEALAAGQQPAQGGAGLNPGAAGGDQSGDGSGNASGASANGGTGNSGGFGTGSGFGAGTGQSGNNGPGGQGDRGGGRGDRGGRGPSSPGNGSPGRGPGGPGGFGAGGGDPRGPGGGPGPGGPRGP